MRGVTWNRDSHGLFDYEHTRGREKAWTTQEEARIIRKDNDIRFVPLKSAATAEKVEVDNSQLPN